MTSVIRDGNREPVWFGVSSTDGVSLVAIQVNSSNGGMKIEDGTSVLPIISAIPSTIPRDENRVTATAGISSTNSATFIPVSVNPATGAILIQST